MEAHFVAKWWKMQNVASIVAYTFHNYKTKDIHFKRILLSFKSNGYNVVCQNNEKLQILIYWYLHLTLEECQWLIGLSQTKFKHSKVKNGNFFNSTIHFSMI